MAHVRCPGCGSAYNGKRCRSCGYEPFTGETTGRSPVRSTAAPKIPSGRKPRRQYPLAGFFALLLLIGALMPMLRDWGLELRAREEAARTAALRPKPVLQPEDTLVFHRQDGITLFASAGSLAHLDTTFCLYVQNDSSTAVTVSAGDIRINDVPQPRAALVCKARSGETGKGWLEPDEAERKEAGISKIRSMSFTLTVLGQDGRVKFTTDRIHLTPEGAAS